MSNEDSDQTMQADLNFLLVHMSEGTFFDVAADLLSRLQILSV